MTVLRFAWLGSAVLAACLAAPVRGDDDAAPTGPPAAPQPSTTTPTPEPAAAPTPEPATAPAESAGWKTSGDFRLRYERTSNQQPTGDALDLSARHREAIRFRIGVARNFGKSVAFGARLATGSAEDPNSTDVGIGEFSDDLEISLDRAFVELRTGAAFLTGGRFPNPLVSTELVWDGDVNPQGVAASLSASRNRGVEPRLVGLFYFLDEQSGPDSVMAGGQAQLSIRPAGGWKVLLAGGYYDYTIKSLRNADLGDTRTNRLAPGGGYLSDFDLLNAVVTFDHPGFSKRSPIRFVGDFVRNLGADDENTGFALDLFVGRASEKGDLRLRYGYSQVETDAVLAAVSHDNTTLATNYRMHTASADYQVRKDIQLNLTWYGYRRLSGGDPAGPNPWTTRLRLNALVTF